MTVLAVESSCDETSVAVIKDGKILSNKTTTQIDIHEKYGGVVPEIAARKHLEYIIPVFEKALEEAHIDLHQVDAFAATYGPGLVGSLLVGLSFAKGLSISLNKPFIAINHLLGHLYANFITFPELKTPFIVLLVSGGHTELFLMENMETIRKIGQTRDDAAGEAFDKIARMLDLGYPGGPAIEKAAESGKDIYTFPRSLRKKNNIDFSFSGLKTSVLYFLRENENFNKEDIAASVQSAIVDSLLEKTFLAADRFETERIVFAGGVAANRHLRNQAQLMAKKRKKKVYFPPIDLCTDNAGMIAYAAYKKTKRGDYSPLDINAVPYLTL
ncbi:MAG: tRNA (adenosine(37)-N6)-threonylcarbamoyltransferase complex transferase subunit TsaD [Kosmotoga sp.]|nr:MAG: tRNA (adenosine(37)-N6)-threonylcarbamoyltransferase complex transferase subunit TsaD [Kosmotoga sp.]